MSSDDRTVLCFRLELIDQYCCPNCVSELDSRFRCIKCAYNAVNEYNLTSELLEREEDVC